MRETYFQQVRLLIEVLPLIAREADFALKGGTAINLFVRDLPRLSVDIDLTYLPIADREEPLAAIGETVRKLAETRVLGIRGTAQSGGGGAATRALLQRGSTRDPRPAS